MSDNPFLPACDDDAETLVKFRVALAAVAEAMPHLPVAAIIDPPHHWFDAALARQIAIHILVNRLDVPKRRVCVLQGRSREAVNRGLMTIDWRLDTPEFEASYRMIAARAEDLLIEQGRAAA